jgi:hypothetical protein
MPLSDLINILALFLSLEESQRERLLAELSLMCNYDEQYNGVSLGLCAVYIRLCLSVVSRQ